MHARTAARTHPPPRHTGPDGCFTPCASLETKLRTMERKKESDDVKQESGSWGIVVLIKDCAGEWEENGRGGGARRVCESVVAGVGFAAAYAGAVAKHRW